LTVDGRPFATSQGGRREDVIRTVGKQDRWRKGTSGDNTANGSRRERYEDRLPSAPPAPRSKDGTGLTYSVFSSGAKDVSRRLPHEALRELTVADAILAAARAHRIELRGESLRKRQI
jgi:hypothetical protein